MLRDIFKFVVGSVVALSLGAVALHTLSPSTAATIEAVVREHTLGWDEGSCRSSPSACLRSKYQTLTDRERQIGDVVELLQSEELRVGTMVEERETTRARNGEFLARGRDLLNGAEPGASILFAGRTYPDAETLKSQLLFLFTEQDDLERATTDARSLQEQLNDQSRALMIQHGNVRAARQLIPAKLALLRGNELFVEFDESIALIDQALTSSSLSLRDADGLIGSTQQLIMSDTGPEYRDAEPSELQQNFADFLRDPPSSP